MWADGAAAQAAAIIWCTGFRPAPAHFAPLKLRGTRGYLATVGTRAVDRAGAVDVGLPPPSPADGHGRLPQ